MPEAANEAKTDERAGVFPRFPSGELPHILNRADRRGQRHFLYDGHKEGPNRMEQLSSAAGDRMWNSSMNSQEHSHSKHSELPSSRYLRLLSALVGLSSVLFICIALVLSLSFSPKSTSWDLDSNGSNFSWPGLLSSTQGSDSIMVTSYHPEGCLMCPDDADWEYVDC